MALHLFARDIFDCIVQRMEQQDGQQATKYDMPEENREKMPGRQASMVSDIMDCQREKMHHSFGVRNLYRAILMRLQESMQHQKAILVDEREAEEFNKQFPYKEKKKLPGQIF